MSNKDSNETDISPETQDSQDNAEEVQTTQPDTQETQEPAPESVQNEEQDEDNPETIIEQLQQQLKQEQENALRARAEAQNSAMRAEQQVEKAHKFALDKFAGDLLPIVDNLERALESVNTADEANDALNAIKEGVNLTMKSFIDTLQKHNIIQLDPEGEPFDPQLHQAVSTIPNDKVEPNSVITVLQKGYTLNHRLVRPALVVVSAAS